MHVWLPLAPPAPVVGGPERQARVSMSFKNSNCAPVGVNDGLAPTRSSEHPGALCHWWPRKGSTEWVQYTWKQRVNVGGARVYWFDDTGHGACRPPVSWRVLYQEGDTWKPVAVRGDYPTRLDKWCEVQFPPVSTSALRLEVKLQTEWAAGVHEWQVVEAEAD
jgi:hypothetical protein